MISDSERDTGDQATLGPQVSRRGVLSGGLAAVGLLALPSSLANAQSTYRPARLASPSPQSFIDGMAEAELAHPSMQLASIPLSHLSSPQMSALKLLAVPLKSPDNMAIASANGPPART